MAKYIPENYFLNPAHEEIARARYYLKDDKGIVVEKNIFESFRRVNNYIYQKDTKVNRELAQKYCEEKKIMYAGRPLAQAGTGIKNMFNCFVLGIDDSRESISETQRVHFHIQAHGGGTGINFSKLRPSGAWCKGANARSSGPEGFITAMGYLSSNIQQGGNRSGANMGILEDRHPGLLNFITKKSRSNWENIRKFAVVTNENKFKQFQWMNPHAWQTFNVSVALSDDFMRQVKRKSSKPWELRWDDTPWHLWDFQATLKDYTSSGEVIEDVVSITVVAPDEEIAVHEASNQLPFRNASTLKLVKGPYHLTAHDWFRKICTNAWEDGCPGIFFVDRARAFHNGEYFNPLDATNPCITRDSFINTLGGINTGSGLQQVKDLIGVPFIAAVDNKLYPCNSGFFSTGFKEIGLLTTKSGFNLKLTPDHRVLTLQNGEEVWKEAKDLKEGNKIVINDTRGSFSVFVRPDDTTERDVGWLVGELLGDGNFHRTPDQGVLRFWGTNKKEMLELALSRLDVLDPNPTRKGCMVSSRDLAETSSKRLHYEALIRGIDLDKNIQDELLKQPHEFHVGFLKGWFDADGSVQGSTSKGISIRLTSVKRENLVKAQLMLLHMGIKSSIYKRRDAGVLSLPDGKGSYSNYNCQATYELIIANSDLLMFKYMIGFDDNIKALKLEKLLNSYKRKTNSTKFTVEFLSYEPLGIEEVFDCTIEEAHRFGANGIVVHNCAEQVLPRNSVCCLSSIVVPEFVNEDGSIDFEDLNRAVCSLVRSLNHITLLNETGIEVIDKNTKIERRIGLGTIGMHELLIRVSTRTGKNYLYSSDTGRALAKSILKFIKHSAYKASIEMAKDIGPFPAFKYKEFIKSKFVQQLLKECPEIEEDLKKYGIANVTILTQAPTGTTGTITGYSSGCEPYFSMAYIRNSNVGSFMDGCPSFHSWLEEKGIDFADYGFNLKELRKHKRVPKYFEEAQEISWLDHLKMQSIFSEQVDSSVSKTINLPNDATVDDIMGAYVSAFDFNIKSTAVYRDGSKTQVLETLKHSSKGRDEARPRTVIELSCPTRPDFLECDIHTVSVKGERWKVLIGLLYGTPYETFCFPEDQIEISPTKIKGVLERNGGGRYHLAIGEGDDRLVIKNVASLLVSDEHRMITRLLSANLRHGTPLPSVVSQLSKCDGDVTAFSKALLRVLRKYISDEQLLEISKCRSCGSAKLVMESGCVQCKDCGFSGCE